MERLAGMVICASTLPLHSWSVRNLYLPNYNEGANVLAVLKKTITSEGVWKIRRVERSPVIEVVKVEASGTGGILTEDFLEWRKQLYAREIAKMLG
jgi:hypothetical protein